MHGPRDVVSANCLIVYAGCLVKVAVWVQRVKKQSFDFLYFFTGSVLCMVQRVYPENLSVIGCFLPEI